MEEKEIGAITHYFGKVGVGMIKLTDSIKIGDTIHIKGHGYDFSQPVSSMQIDYKNIETATAGQDVGVKVDQKVHPNDKVFKVIA